MSLQVWLPLTKDLRNQGLASSANFGDTTAFATTGKLGAKSLYSNAQKTAVFAELANVTNFSFAYWIKVDSSITVTNWADIIGLECITGNDTTIIRDEFTATAGQHQILMGKDSTVGSNSYTYYGVGNTNTGAKDIWTHYVIIKNNTNTYVYTNGILTNTLANTNFEKTPQKLTGKIYLGNTSSTAAQINDVRIYDHCLSPIEVKELSKGLILHYPLNRGGWGQENLLANTNTGVSYWNWTMQAGDYTRTEETALSKVKGCKLTRGNTTQSGWSVIYWNLIDESILTTSTQYTLSLDIYPSVDTSFNVCILEANGTNQFAPYAGAQAVIANKWNHLTFSLTTVATFPSSTNETLYFTGMNSGTEVSYIFRNLKLEKGSTATPWCPNSSDALATAMGLNGITEYDCSGFCNNGTRVGTFIWTSDTPKYSVSQVFSGNQRIEAPFNPSNSPTFTIAGWFYHTGGTTYYGAKNNYNTFVCLEGGRYFVYNSAGSAYVGTWTSTANTWQHVVLVHDAATTKLKLYVNGNFISEVTTNGTIYGSDILDIGGRQGAAQYSGKMSDFRIYATALSASDVKSLYQNSAYIDLSGNVYGAVHSEV